MSKTGLIIGLFLVASLFVDLSNAQEMPSRALSRHAALLGECVGLHNLIAKEHARRGNHEAALAAWKTSGRYQDVGFRPVVQGGDPMAFTFNQMRTEEKLKNEDFSTLLSLEQDTASDCETSYSALKKR